MRRWSALSGGLWDGGDGELRTAVGGIWTACLAVECVVCSMCCVFAVLAVGCGGLRYGEL